MAKFFYKTMDEWDDIVDKWHEDKNTEQTLQEYMGLNEIEFLRYLHNITDPNLTDEEVEAEASKKGREAMVGLTLMEIFEDPEMDR